MNGVVIYLTNTYKCSEIHFIGGNRKSAIFSEVLCELDQEGQAGVAQGEGGAVMGDGYEL